MKPAHPFESTSKRRKGFPSETRVKHGHRTIKGGEIELIEKLGRDADKLIWEINFQGTELRSYSA